MWGWSMEDKTFTSWAVAAAIGFEWLIGDKGCWLPSQKIAAEESLAVKVSRLSQYVQGDLHPR